MSTITIIIFYKGNAFTVIEDFEDGTDPKGRQMQMTRFGIINILIYWIDRFISPHTF